MPSSLTGLVANAKSDAQQQALHRIVADEAHSFADLARAVAAYCGPLPSDLPLLLGARLRALRPDLFRTAESVAALLQSDNLASVQDWRDAVPYSFFTAADDDQLFRTELLPRRDNAHWSAELPATLARRLLASECPSLETISARGVSLFCSPEGFQVFSASDGYYVRSSTSRPLSTAVMNVAHIDVDGPVVLVQDIFHGSNFAHFLFDWIIRVMAFAASRPIDPRDCVFVMGGFPKPFHQIVLRTPFKTARSTRAGR